MSTDRMAVWVRQTIRPLIVGEYTDSYTQDVQQGGSGQSMSTCDLQSI